MSMENIVIIGNGIAGITAARHIRKLSDNKLTVISSETEYFFSRTALMYVYMGHMKFEHTKPYEDWFWSKNDIQLVRDHVEEIETSHQTITLSSGRNIEYDKLILATGSTYNKFGWPGEDLKGVQGLVSKQDLDLLETNAPNNNICKHAVIVGGGLIGVELAEMLSTRDIPVTFLVREDGFWRGVLPKSDAHFISDHIRSHGIDLRHNEELSEIHDDGSGRVNAVTTKNGEKISCDLVGLCAGVSPRVSLAERAEIDCEKGILVDRYLRSSAENVYAIGDCAQQREPVGDRKAVEAVWYTGRMMGETVAQTICGKPMKWNPGHWFNSAKFFDVEYQTYGWVWNNLKEDRTHYHWEDKGEDQAITVEYEKGTRKFIGINTFGIRLRHEVFTEWLDHKATIDEVIDNLEKASFDPEFYKKPFQQIKQHYQANKEES